MHSGRFGGGRGFGGGGGGGRDFNDKAAPVRVGEEVDVTIEAVGAKGDGIARKEGFVIFVPSTSTGDSVRIRITKVLSNVAFAEVASSGSGSGSGSGGEASSNHKSKSDSEYAAEAAGPVEQPVDTDDFGEEEN